MNIKKLDKLLSKVEEDPKFKEMERERERKELEDFINLFMGKLPTKKIFKGGDNLIYTFYK